MYYISMLINITIILLKNNITFYITNYLNMNLCLKLVLKILSLIFYIDYISGNVHQTVTCLLHNTWHFHGKDIL